jgi:uncharacterized membrane protein YidH (DUF202 family)
MRTGTEAEMWTGNTCFHRNRHEEGRMAIGISIVLVALGAILIWGTSADVGGVELTTVGVVLVAFGAAGFVAALAYWPTRRRRDERRIVDR